MQRKWCREKCIKLFPGSLQSEDIQISQSYTVIHLGADLDARRYIYMPTANIFAFNDEKHKSQADGFATAKHGLQFPGLHHVSPQRARQALNTKFCCWRPMKKRPSGIRTHLRPQILSLSLHSVLARQQHA